MSKRADTAIKVAAIEFYLATPGVSQLDAVRHFTHNLTGGLRAWYKDGIVRGLLMEKLGCTAGQLDEMYRARVRENCGNVIKAYRAYKK